LEGDHEVRVVGRCGEGVGGIGFVFGEGRDKTAADGVAPFIDGTLDVHYFSYEEGAAGLNVKLLLLGYLCLID